MTKRDYPGRSIGQRRYLEILDAAIERARCKRLGIKSATKLRGETLEEFRLRIGIKAVGQC